MTTVGITPLTLAQFEATMAEVVEHAGAVRRVEASQLEDARVVAATLREP